MKPKYDWNGFAPMKNNDDCDKIITVKRFYRTAPIDKVNPDPMCGQTRDGYYGHFCAYVAFPRYWAIARLSDKELSDVCDVYGGVDYRKLRLPNGVCWKNKVVIGWNYSHGFEDERLVDEETVGRDITSCCTNILKYQWEAEPKEMLREYNMAIEKMVYRREYALAHFVDKNTPEGEEIAEGMDDE